MKTNQLILAAAALVVLASCTKSNVGPVNTAKTEGDEIGFNAVTQKATKANDAIISGATYGTDNTFQIWGWQSENGLFTDTYLVDDYASNFMSNLKIEWTKGWKDASDDTDIKASAPAEAWRNADNYYYWPFTGKISFLAVHPSTVAPTTTGWDATNKKPQATIDDYTICKDDSTTDVNEDNSTTDLMFAIATGSRNAGLDAQGRLGLVFKHALSQIQFRARTNEDYSHDVTFTLNSVTLNNIDLSGDLAYANNAFDWSDNEDQDDDWAYYATSQVVNYAANDAAAALYGAANVMIPQNANADDPATTNAIEGTTITINYTMEQYGSAAITGTVTVAAPWTKVKEGETNHNPAVAISAWEPGKKYNYTLNFKLNEILINPEVTNWVEVEMSTVNILD